MKEIRYLILILSIGAFNTISSAEIQFDSMEKINTSQNEFAPSISSDGKFMLFNSKRGNDKFMDIYVSYFKNGFWSSPVKFDILNSAFNDETPFISKDGKIIVFASDRDGSRELKIKAKTLVSYDLYWSHKINGKWTLPVPVPGDINTGNHERAPALSADNKSLYFSRWGAGKLQNAAIMFAEFINGKFLKAREMPPEINSGNMEVALIPDSEGSGFYFSSTRDNGSGGWDIYYISAHNGDFGRAVNLGDKINSKFNEAFFSILNGRIYYCSDRAREGKDYDILQTFLPGEKQLFFRISDNQNNPVIASAEIHKILNSRMPQIVKKKSNQHGSFSEYIPDDLDSIDLFIEEKGYLPYYRRIEKSELLNPEFDIVLTPIQSNSSFSIEAIHFDYEKADIKEESFSYLDRLASYLNKNPGIDLQIIGHTDLHGPDEYNMALSKNRALSVQKYLVEKGVAENRLGASGMGKSNPVVNEINDHADRLNRRTEFRIMEK